MKSSSHDPAFLVMPKSRTKPKRNGETSSSTTSRQSPASIQDVTSMADLPVPQTIRNLRPRMTRSRASSSRGSHSASNSRSTSVLSTVTGDSDRPVTRQRKKQKLEASEAASSTSATASGSSTLDTAPRPEWRNTDDEDENLDQLEDSDVEEVGGPDASQTQASTQITEEQSEAGPDATQNLSPTPPPLTALSSTQDTTGESPSSSSVSIVAGPGGTPGSSSRGRRAPAPHETPASPVSSPSLMKIINQTNISPGTIPSKRKRASPSPDDLDIIEISNMPGPTRKDKGKGKARAISLSATPPPPPRKTETKTNPEPEPLSEYTCPICFFPPSNATLTPCGHVCCGSCLFMAVKTTLQRGASMGMPAGAGENVARCPVCRASIPGWDGKGGGVVGLKVREIISL
ncbi:hypothetical protein D9756_002905 [Leucocoprinus leucothites]|uniref:RING-type domain-containing protein n=1 Tax=Leucocoprinus leucothites TaxID=201217 RepID=A0A8H5G6Y0_9AGAR|nr:hypothetical protein D9756_002905 [Leucoagaricus leucothites]